MRLRLAIVALATVLLTLPLFAQPSYTMTPDSGPVTGGTTVTIKGDFGAWPYWVIFGTTPAASTTKVDEHTLTAVTPAHVPGAVPIVIFEYDMGLFTNLTFTFTGNADDAFETVLLPVFVPPIQGQFGSEFRTELTGRNDGGEDIDVYGLPTECVGECDQIPAAVLPPVTISANDTLTLDQPPNGNPGRLLYIPKETAPYLSLNLRAYDTSRSATNFGTEIPIPRSSDFRSEPFSLTGVPLDPRFRLTLRLYSWQSPSAPVRITFGTHEYQVPLRAPANLYEPWYADFTAFPAGVPGDTTTVVLEPMGRLDDILSAPIPWPLWGFITVTNNDTQHITTITPRQ